MVQFLGNDMVHSNCTETRPDGKEATNAATMLGLTNERAVEIAHAVYKGAAAMVDRLMAEIKTLGDNGAAFDINLMPNASIDELLSKVEIDLTTPAEALLVGIEAGRAFNDLQHRMAQSFKMINMLRTLTGSASAATK